MVIRRFVSSSRIAKASTIQRIKTTNKAPNSIKKFDNGSDL